MRYIRFCIAIRYTLHTTVDRLMAHIRKGDERVQSADERDGHVDRGLVFFGNNKAMGSLALQLPQLDRHVFTQWEDSRYERHRALST